MQWRDTQNRYGPISISLHWLIAIAVTGLFALGLWMVELDYYHPWYLRAPDLHKGTGMLLFGVMVLRWAWRYRNPRPRILGKPWEQRSAGLMHHVMYVLLFVVILTGYLISTADGRPIGVFSLFEVPATLSGLENQEDIAGVIHKVLAYILIGLAILHVLAALKHHFIDRDDTLRRMLGTRYRS